MNSKCFVVLFFLSVSGYSFADYTTQCNESGFGVKCESRRSGINVNPKAAYEQGRAAGGGDFGENFVQELQARQQANYQNNLALMNAETNRQLAEQQAQLIQEQRELVREQREQLQRQSVLTQSQAVDEPQVSAQTNFPDQGEYFLLGDTEDAVLSVQGNPSSLSGALGEWYYGKSYVSFDADKRVRSYYDAGELKVRKGKSLPNYETIGVPAENEQHI